MNCNAAHTEHSTESSGPHRYELFVTSRRWPVEIDVNFAAAILRECPLPDALTATDKFLIAQILAPDVVIR